MLSPFQDICSIESAVHKQAVREDTFGLISRSTTSTFMSFLCCRKLHHPSLIFLSKGKYLPLSCLVTFPDILVLRSCVQGVTCAVASSFSLRDALM